MQKLVVQQNPKSPVSEAYRTLRTNIQFASLDKDIKTIVITSSGPKEGKSTTSSNLALTLAENSKKVILIDCDLRKPSVHRYFGISNKVGLSNLLVEDLSQEDVIVKYSENLSILPCGTIPPSPADILSSHKMKTFIEELKYQYDIILLDTPPVIAVTDAQLLAAVADGVLLVASSGEVEKEAICRAKDLLEHVNANILGVVLNKVEIKNRRGHSYGYYYYYGGEKKEKRAK